MKQYIRAGRRTAWGVVKTTIGGAAERLGYTIVPNRQLGSFALARHLREVMSLCRIDCVIDVGANKGQFGRMLRHQVGFTGRILSFEPVSTSFQALLKEAAGDPSWQCFQLALGREAGEKHINVMKSDVFSSFLRPRHTAWFAGDNEIASTEVCTVERLDAWLARRALPYPSLYLKLDTQGYDLDVLQGATGVLDRIRAMQTELSFVPIYEDMPGFREMIDYAEGVGYRVSNLFPVNVRDGLAVEFDCVLVKPEPTLVR